MLRKPKTTRFGVSIPEDLIERFDKLIDKKSYANRSEAIRDLIRACLVDEEWQDEDSRVVGTITIVYDHHTRDLAQGLTGAQHDHLDEIVCTSHVHLDAHNCLEVIVVRGSARSVRSIADRLISTRGVKHGKLVCTTTGGAI